MARQVRSNALESRTGRLKLTPRGKPYFIKTGRAGVHLGYRRIANTNGSWILRRYTGGKSYAVARMADADDHTDADGAVVIDYWQAQARAAEDESIVQRRVQFTVKACLVEYMADYRVRAKSPSAVKMNQCNVGLIERGTLGDCLVSNLTRQQVRKWLTGLAHTASDDLEVRRKRKVSANRLFTVLRAALNFAYASERVTSDAGWRRVKPFKGVENPSARYLMRGESVRLLNACPHDFRRLVRAALETGCRYMELATMRARQFDAGSGHVGIGGKSEFRHVPLSKQGVAYFKSITAGLEPDALIFTKQDGEPWGVSHQARPINAACQAANIKPRINFHHLRHTYASTLAMEGAPLDVIAKALGHKDLRITTKFYAHLSPSYFDKAIRDNMPSYGAVKSNVRSIR